MKKLSFLLFGLILLLAACGSGGSSEPSNEPAESTENTNGTAEETPTETKSYKIGITQIVEHASLDSATEGFIAAIEESGLDVEFVKENAQNDQSMNITIAQKLVSENVDLIFANSTPSAQAAKSATGDIPIIFTSVTDPIGAELVDSMEAPGANVTGTVDLHPETISNTVDFIIDELGITKVGTIYNTGEQNSVVQVKQMKELLEAKGATLTEASVSTSAEVKQAAESLLGQVEAYYIITDNTVVTALSTVVDVANTNQLPLIVGELDSVAGGGLAAYGFSYYDIGYEAGEMAVKILKGEATPSEIPAAYPANLKLVINKATAETIGVEIQDSWNAEVIE
ncbi:ABC transporter substrate-binding protein [Ureibacillus massiliensis 4400831 = CIP 108448 = CCUG 49529]|uniref:ABC transporter substrate-binding protein n=1 Tax=Ureibacillus massiliensis 4400831 = CIP 108448 = CCUG 49529 TaxID=1211035 RepID=A0A0A3JB63_9BACL|nr:ABC transporter substrate-binding protein [Ureibacillus massiliensis]KGR92413.1 ABC transporter substrate-binding protein [Ureibacillus massiliensis 4400831 = CIP 108448 = CCUG 49529]